jgi:hypothetical protein
MEGIENFFHSFQTDFEAHSGFYPMSTEGSSSGVKKLGP